MASLQKKGDSWYCQFYWRNERFTFAIGRLTRPQAEVRATKAGEVVELLERGMLELPQGVKVAEFVKHDGRPPSPAELQKASQKLTLGALRDHFLEARKGGREASTQMTTGIHFKHLVATLGERFPLPGLAQADLHRHVDRRLEDHRHDDQEGDHRPADGLALGRRRRVARGRLPEQGRRLSQGGRVPALPDARGDRAAGRSGRPVRGPGRRAVGFALPPAGGTARRC